MKFKGKEVKVVITGAAEEQLEDLNKVVGEERSKGIKKSDHQVLLKSIKQKVEFLKENPEYGFHIAKNLIPKQYIKEYEVNNLWKINFLVHGE